MHAVALSCGHATGSAQEQLLLVLRGSRLDQSP